VLDRVDARVRSGCVTGLLGPSGSGKSTLLRAWLGVQRTREGRVAVLGRPAGAAELRRRVSYAPQGGGVYADLTVEQNVRYFAAAVGAGRSDVDRAISIVRLGPHRRRLAAQLSGGELSRVSLAVAVVGHPQLLLLDEPTVGLDPVLRMELWSVFAALARDGHTVVVSSHVMDEAERCDTLILLRAGRVVAQGSPAALKERTATGSMDAAFLRIVQEQAR
jgi:ABC-2 type transport system ATP-binding protein